MNKYLPYVLWSVGISAVLVLLGFVEKSHQNLLCERVVINISQNDENYFIEDNDISSMLPFDVKHMDSIPVRNIEAEIIEKKLNNHPAIFNSEVYQSLDGSLHISVIQRRPIARVFTSNGDSYYLDEVGNIMPLSHKFTARVMVISGYLEADYNKLYQYNMKEVLKDDSLRKVTLLDDLFKLASFIHQNDFWKAQIEHLYVNKESEVELIPRVGNHTIVFGEIADIAEKFEKLMVFYQKGLSKTGWNEYSKINLKFENQVVCTKRY